MLLESWGQLQDNHYHEIGSPILETKDVEYLVEVIFST